MEIWSFIRPGNQKIRLTKKQIKLLMMLEITEKMCLSSQKRRIVSQMKSKQIRLCQKTLRTNCVNLRSNFKTSEKMSVSGMKLFLTSFSN